eukprot:CAMPEP_0197828374 /NCGR_PEP_ID=MMETSP1437-20131217/4949_1 /TAXON_ID=49252 ORGANISM="Eucampia antarctica, Strain CCMP1452" /NCGR_SAMPLE_ID=MMETSP1437 /ASSEMBLY_ACC=CAM_ASM_001096 /LENGTH=424 /DNA_ID=CAMNT_0043429555 /DNA_START=14 /DNA_END=1288 /DNA_ORIENTATION=-
MSSAIATAVTRGWVRTVISHNRSPTLSSLCSTSWDSKNFSTANKKNEQKFVEASFDAGADGEVAWKNRAMVMSAEDFENRPKAGFEEEFSSMYDAMSVLSWLNDKDKHKIYDLYLELMRTMADRHSNITSHEYVIRVVAQKFNISKNRAAAVIAQSHEEERLKASGQTLHVDAQQYVDAKIQQHIAAAYSTYNEADPNPDPNVTFIEDPNFGGITTSQEDENQPTEIRDLVDVDQMTSKAKLRLQEEAQIAISNRIYAEDVDPDQTPVPITRTDECHTLLHRKNQEYAHIAQNPPHYPSNTEQQRPRWKFVAKTIHTRKDSQKKKKRRQSHNHKMANTLVEHNGILRVATVKEASNTSFLKSKRDVTDFTLANVKQAWIDRQLFGKVGGWGRAPEQPKQEIPTKPQDNSELNSPSTDANKDNEN